MIYFFLAVALAPLLIIGLVVSLTNPCRALMVFWHGLKYLGVLMLVSVGISIAVSIATKPLDTVSLSQNIASLMFVFFGVPVFFWGIYAGYVKNYRSSPASVSVEQSQAK